MKGLVTGTKGDLLVVNIHRKEACGSCRACLSGMMETEMDIDAENLCDAEIGDWVELELQENSFLHAVLLAYGVPFVAFLAGLFLGYYAIAPFVPFHRELFALFCAVLCLFLAYFWLKSQNPRWEKGKYRPMAVRLTTEGYDDDDSSCAAH